MRACIQSTCRSPTYSIKLFTCRVPSLARPTICQAKKGKKGGKKGNKKGGSLLGELANVPKIQPWQTTEMIMQHLLMIESYRRAAGEPLVEKAEIEKIADVLNEAPFAILSHNRFAPNVPDGEAVFTFANKAALEVFQADSWSDLVGAKSTVCIAGLEEGVHTDREALLKSIVPAAAESAPVDTPPENDGPDEESDGDVEGNSRRVAGAQNEVKLIDGTGRRVGLKGRNFEITYKLWNILSPTGTVVGQAACFDQYQLEDGTIVKIGEAPPEDSPEASPEDIAAAEAMVDEQAEQVRALKAQEGLTNKSPEVQEAVAELLNRKERLQAMQASIPVTETVV